MKADLSEEKLESIRKVNTLNGNRSRIVKRNDFVYSSISTAFLIGFIGNIIVASRVLFFVSDNRIHVAILLDWLSKSTPIYQSSRLDHMRSFRSWEYQPSWNSIQLELNNRLCQYATDDPFLFSEENRWSRWKIETKSLRTRIVLSPNVIYLDFYRADDVHACTRRFISCWWFNLIAINGIGS